MTATQKDIQAIERARKIKDVPWCDAYEKMISGMAFRSWESAELEKGQSRAVGLCREYNKTDPFENGVTRADVMLKRTEILKSLLGDMHGTPTIEIPFSISYGCNTSIGQNFFGNVGLAIDDNAFVTIGDDVVIGPNVHFITLNHATDVSERLQGSMFALPIKIGSACWIGARATVLPGATIGYGCTIGAGAVVSGNIPEYSVAVGVPARVVRRVLPVSPTSTSSIPDLQEVKDPANDLAK